jgi:pyoverdine/dityrosine biosynthesis protein Dit1
VEFLQSFCEQLSHFYPPGGAILICSDGHVFADLLGIPDDDVTAYRDDLLRIIQTTGSASLSMYSLRDAFDSDDWDEMRALLLGGYGTPIDDMHAEVRNDLAARGLFNGMHRFMVETRPRCTPA